MNFLTETNISIHKEYLRTLKLKQSIFNKSYPGCNDGTFFEISKCRMPKDERDDFLRLKAEIIAHEVYFDSFGSENSRSELVAREYGSEAGFLYFLYEKCINQNGFLLLFVARDKINFFVGEDYSKLFIKYSPVLCIDLYEHAYFFDYGFDKKKYLQNALSNLNLSKLKY